MKQELWCIHDKQLQNKHISFLNNKDIKQTPDLSELEDINTRIEAKTLITDYSIQRVLG